MYRYSKYIVRHLAHSMALITISLTSIVWLTQALRFIDFMVNQGVSITVFLTLTLLLVPSLLLMILPPALFCATLFVYNRLLVDSELVVMQASGLSRWRLSAPALQAAAAVAILTYVIALYLQPASYRHFRDMQAFLRNNYISILLQEGVFSNPVDGLTVFIRERDPDNTLHGILVHDNRQAGRAVTMMAEKGNLVETSQGPRFLLQDGNRQEANRGKLSFLHFDHYTLDISLYDQQVKTRPIDPQELSLAELFSYDREISPGENQKRRAEGHQRLLWPLYPFALALVAMAVMLSGQFNRRGHWQRIAIAVAIGTVMLFSAIGLRGTMALNPDMTILAYLNLLLPCLAAGFALGHDGSLPGRLRRA